MSFVNVYSPQTGNQWKANYGCCRSPSWWARSWGASEFYLGCSKEYGIRVKVTCGSGKDSRTAVLQNSTTTWVTAHKSGTGAHCTHWRHLNGWGVSFAPWSEPLLGSSAFRRMWLGSPHNTCLGIERPNESGQFQGLPEAFEFLFPCKMGCFTSCLEDLLFKTGD